ncbi:MAG: acyl-CoA carboxylase subunit beta [Clostridia bacterium]
MMEHVIEQLKQKKENIKQGGGQKRIDSQHSKGKMTARERLDILLDEGSFIEIGMFVKHRSTDLGMDKIDAPGEGVVTGYGTINGRLVYVFAQDFTVIAGTLGEMHAKKITKVMDLAIKNGAPLIGINDSGGARIQEGVDALNGYGEIFYRNTMASGVIPQISVILGPCAGGAVYSPALTDFIFMAETTSKMFITGPQVIKSVTGEDVSSDDLGGGIVHNQKSGVSHFLGKDEEDTLLRVRELIDFLPQNNMEQAGVEETSDEPWRTNDKLIDMVPLNPNKGYDVRDVVKEVVDNEYFLEVHEHYAQNMVVGFAKINGRSVGIVANNPRILAGCLDIDGSDKGSRFIRFCDAFSIPLVTFIDVPGYLPGVGQEYGGIIRHGAKLLYAYSEANVPKISVILRKAYGGAYLAMCSKALGADMVYSWPNAEIAVMGPSGAANIIFRKEIAAADNPPEKRQEKINEYSEKFANPYVAASRGLIDDVIDPRQTRISVINALESCSTKRENRFSKKHGNIPL